MRRRSFLLVLLSLLIAATVRATVTGIVVREDGTPVAGATVRAYPARTYDEVLRDAVLNGASVPLAAATTAADGRFSVDAKDNPVVHLVIDAPSLSTAVINAADRQDVGAVILGNPRTIRIVGDGKPLANAVVLLAGVVLRSDPQGRIAASPDLGLAAFAPDFALGGELKNDELTLSRGITLRGKVVGADGAPAANATIVVNSIPLGTSASDGTFSIAHVPEHWRAIEARSGATAGAVANKPGADLTIRLRPAVSVSGDVTANGVPVAGATVTAGSMGTATGRAAITDAKGHYVIDGLVPSTYIMHAAHPLFALPKPSEVSLLKSTKNDIRLAPLARFTGRVAGEDNQPMPGAIVMLMGVNRAATLSGPAGAFSLSGPGSVGITTVVASKSGYALSALSLRGVDNGQTKSDLTLRLRKGFPLQIKVIDTDRQPVANARIDLGPSPQELTAGIIPTSTILCSLSTREGCRSGADGVLNVRVAEGKYDLRVSGESIVTKTMPRQAIDAKSSPLTVTVDRGVEASGRVTYDDGTPVANARVMTRASNESAYASADANGAFTLKGLSRTPVVVIASMPDDVSLTTAPVTITPPARNVSIVFPKPARIEGRVIDRATTRPVTSFSLGVRSKDSPFGMAGRMPFNNDDGTFVIPRVTPGALTLTVQAPGYVLATISDVVADAGKTVSGVEVSLDRGAKITGHVNAGGKPLAAVRVRRESRGPRGETVAVITDDSGDFTIDGVPPGDQSFEFYKDGYAIKHKSVTIEAGNDVRLDVDLDRGRQLQGRVIDRQGVPVAGAQINAQSTRTMPGLHTTSADDGTFSLAGFDDAQRYQVFVRKTGFVTASLTDVDPNSAQPLNFTLDRGGAITGQVRGLSDTDLSQVQIRASGSNTYVTAEADATGAFTLGGVPDGHVTVSAVKLTPPQRDSGPHPVEVVNGTAPPVEIDFSEGATVRGKVTRNGTPVLSGTVFFAAKNPASAMGARMTYGQIGADGTYEVGGLAAGDYNVHVSISGVNETRQYTVSGSGTFDIDLQGSAIHGRVTDAATRAPLPDSTVMIVPSKSGQVSATVFTDSDGRFVIDTIPDGTFNVRASHDGYSTDQQSVTLNGGAAAPLEIALSSGTPMVFRVVDADTGAVLDARVSLFGGPHNFNVSASPVGDGTQKAWVEPGTYKANVFAPGYATSSVDVTAPGPEVRMPLTKGGTLLIKSISGGSFVWIRPQAPSGGGVVGVVRAAIYIRAGESQSVGSLPPGPLRVQKLDADQKTVLKEYVVNIASGQTATLVAD